MANILNNPPGMLGYAPARHKKDNAPAVLLLPRNVTQDAKNQINYFAVDVYGLPDVTGNTPPYGTINFNKQGDMLKNSDGLSLSLKELADNPFASKRVSEAAKWTLKRWLKRHQIAKVEGLNRTG